MIGWTRGDMTGARRMSYPSQIELAVMRVSWAASSPATQHSSPAVQSAQQEGAGWSGGGGGGVVRVQHRLVFGRSGPV